MEEVGGCDGDGYNASSSYSSSYSDFYSGSHFEGSSLKVGQTIVHVILIISLAIISIVGVVGNFLVILSLSIDSRKLGITSILLGSLAITDFFVTAWYVPMEIKFIISPVWRFGAVLCMFNGFLGVFVQSSSACMLLVISCERWCFILFISSLCYLIAPIGRMIYCSTLASYAIYKYVSCHIATVPMVMVNFHE